MIHVLVFAATLAAVSPTPAPAAPPSPAPMASPAPADDPCGGPGRLLATLDRPTVGFSPCAVAPGMLLLEEGYQSQINGTNESGASYLDQYPQSIIRYGLAQRFEFDLIGPNYVRAAAPDGKGGLARTQGYSDGGLGIKVEFAPRGRTTVAVDGLYTAPNGSPGFTAGGATETLNLDAGYALSDTVGIGTTLALQSTSGFDAAGNRARYGVFLPSVVVTKQLPRATQLYGEYVYASKLAPDQSGRAFVDGGVQKLLGSRFELDVELGQSLIGDPSKRFHYLGLGFGVRLR